MSPNCITREEKALLSSTHTKLAVDEDFYSKNLVVFKDQLDINAKVGPNKHLKDLVVMRFAIRKCGDTNI